MPKCQVFATIQSMHCLVGILMSFENETDPEAFLQLVMHPGRSAAPAAKIRMTEMMPPLTIFTDDRYLMHGPYKNQGWDGAEPLLRMATLATQTLDWLGEQSDRLPR